MFMNILFSEQEPRFAKTETPAPSARQQHGAFSAGVTSRPVVANSTPMRLSPFSYKSRPEGVPSGKGWDEFGQEKEQLCCTMLEIRHSDAVSTIPRIIINSKENSSYSFARFLILTI